MFLILFSYCFAADDYAVATPDAECCRHADAMMLIAADALILMRFDIFFRRFRFFFDASVFAAARFHPPPSLLIMSYAAAHASLRHAYAIPSLLR